MSARSMTSFVLLTATALLLLLHSPAGAILVDTTNFTETSFVFVGSDITGIAWAPDGSNRLFVTRKGGQVRIVKDGALLATPFATETVYTGSECGLIGMAFDPGFVTNGYVYFFATVSITEQQIIRYTTVGDTGTNRTVIMPGLPTVGQNHDGGAVGFGPDGMLYWAIGDQGNGTGVDADLTSLAAKVGRALPNGNVPGDNPFVDGAGPNNDYIWARGFRNPFTFTWRPETEQLWVNSVGTAYEQVFVVGRGDHAGWNDYENNQPAGFIRPVIAYRTNGVLTHNIATTGASRSGGVATFTLTGNHNSLVGAKMTIAGVADASFNGSGYITAVPTSMTFQIAQAGPDAASGGGMATTLDIGGAITGGAFFESTAFPAAYRGDFFFGDFNTGRFVRADILPSGQIASVDIWATNEAQAIDVDIGPDGNMYVARLPGSIVRMAFNASSQGLVVSRRFLRTSEGSIAAFNVRLAMAPVSDVSVAVAHAAGDSELSVTQGASLTFTPSNWATPQIVHVTSANDSESVDQVATFTVSSAGLASEDVVVRATSNTVLAPSAPANFQAEATAPTSISLTWTAASGATDYEIERSSAVTNFQTLTTVQTNSHADTTAAAATSYLYRVRATNAGGSSLFSNVDMATSVIFTNDPIVAQETTVQAAHISQLRTAVEAVRTLAVLPNDAWTDSSLVSGLTLIRKIHVEELRSRLSDAFIELGLPSLTLTDPTLTTATPVKAPHIQELRNAVK